MVEVDDIEEEYNQLIKNNKGEDIMPQLFVKQPGIVELIEMPEGVNYEQYEAIKMQVKEIVYRVSWCCLVTTVYMRQIPDDLIDDYDYGDLENDDGAIECHMIHVHTSNDQKMYLYDRENGQLVNEISGDEIEGGRLM